MPKEVSKPEGPICPYCSGPSRLVSGSFIYPYRPDLSEKNFWYCGPCKAYVGCHADTKTPLGDLADAKLRTARAGLHTVFDRVWKSGVRSRDDSYAWLAKQLGIPVDKCHIGMFDLETCKRALALCSGPDTSD